MTIDQHTTAIIKISAAVACNALAALRLAITEGLEAGLTKEEVEEIVSLAKDIQQQPISHVTHLSHQILRDPKKNHHEHGPHCGCGKS